MSNLTEAEDPVLFRVKKCILGRIGTGGIKEIAARFRIMDVNEDHNLSPEEFGNALKSLGCVLTPFELKHLIGAFDTNRDGSVSIDEFLKHLRGGLNPRRRALVRRAFTKFDRTGDGKIDIEDLRGTFKAANHPAVLAGKATEEEILLKYLAGFESGKSDGIVTWEEFEAYYTGVSCSIDNDDYFEAMILKTWELDDAAAPRLNSTHRDWGPGGDPLSIKGPVSREELYSATLKRPPNHNYDHSHMEYPRERVQHYKSVKPNYETTNRSAFPNPFEDASSKTLNQTSRGKTQEVEVPMYKTGNAVLDRLRKKILDRAGPDGFLGVSRTFRIIDKDRNATLSPEELTTGMARYGIKLTPLEVSTVMKYFDKDGNNTVSLTEFLRGLRGPLTNPKRLELVLVAFGRIDVDGSGHVSLSEVASRYDTSQHPMVLDGKKTPEEVLQDFIADWDADGNNVVTQEEFVEYYSNISAGIDNDQYFELMIRNAWHISGGSGVAANTTCRRVLVTFNDDSQKVLEIKDDLGLRKDDIEGMKRRLMQQGHKGIKKISLAD